VRYHSGDSIWITNGLNQTKPQRHKPNYQHNRYASDKTDTHSCLASVVTATPKASGCVYCRAGHTLGAASLQQRPDKPVHRIKSPAAVLLIQPSLKLAETVLHLEIIRTNFSWLTLSYYPVHCVCSDAADAALDCT
jgi:hypothetical protein